MKLNDGFVTQTVGDEHYTVSVGNTGFSGIVHSNETAGFIIDMLKEETSEDAIVDAMFEKYDAERDHIAASVRKIIDQLRSIGAIDE